MAKGYNKRNKLLQIQVIVEIFVSNKTPDISNRDVFRKFILPAHKITERTLYNYLATNYKKLLKDFNGDMPKVDNQLKIF